MNLTDRIVAISDGVSLLHWNDRSSTAGIFYAALLADNDSAGHAHVDHDIGERRLEALKIVADKHIDSWNVPILIKDRQCGCGAASNPIVNE
jgi:hypothetical protein